MILNKTCCLNGTPSALIDSEDKMSRDGCQVPGSNDEITREVTNGILFISPSSCIYPRLIAGIRAKMKDETTYKLAHVQVKKLMLRKKSIKA